MTVFRDGPEFGATIDAAAGHRQINAAIVEKDYWVTQALRALAMDFPGCFIFKGGTSLSKCCRLNYYDIYMLLGDDRALAVLKDRTRFSQIMESMREVNDRWFGGGELRPAGGWATSPAFDTAASDYPRLQRACNSVMEELNLGQEDPPPLDLICARIAELGDLL